MACFIELVTEPFDDVREKQANSQKQFSDMGGRIARRPLRGLEIKEDRVAAVKVVRADGSPIPLIDAGDIRGGGENNWGYTNFILQNVSEARMEKHQIVETFGESYIFFFGESPRFLDVSMIVINSNDFNWEAEWWENYDRYFRGTKLVEMGARLYMFYDDNVVEGYMLNCQAQKVSDQPLMVQMNFRLFLTGYRNISFVGNPQFPIRSSVLLPENILTDTTSRSSLSSYLRSAPQTVSYPPGIDQRIAELGLPALEEARDAGLAIRSKISDNRDEFLGLPENDTQSSGLLANAPTIRSQQEVEDLQQEAIRSLSVAGANIDDPQTMRSLGMMPVFGPDGQDADAATSFTPRSGDPFGTSLSSVDARAPNPYRDSNPYRNQRDPLGAVFGGGNDSSIIDRSTVQGGGDREYGYASDHATRPGFGKPGYGDYGGNGFGSGQGAAGDPGFKDPSLFSFVGVSENQAAFTRFNRPTRNNTVFGSGTNTRRQSRIGLGSSNSGLSGGCSTTIPGRPSSFAVVSVNGAPVFIEEL